MKSNSTCFVFRLKPHEDLKKALLELARQHKWKAAAVVTCVGSLEQFHLRYANQENGSKQQGHFEIVSLTGTLSESSAHLHLSVSDSTGRTLGGHLLDDNLIYTTAEIVLVELTDVEFTREKDNTYGYSELKVKKKE
jgi:predicted DNA-binding protein with PD1-like motif